jgi:hypothetical protein
VTYFVVAADGAWIRRSYEVAYEKFVLSVAEPGLPLGYLFLDKLFQLRVPVPTVDAPRQEEYLGWLLGANEPEQLAVQDPGESERAVRAGLERSTSEAEVVEALQRASPEVRDRVAGTAVARLTAREVATGTEHRLQRFSSLLPPNPRSMKRFVIAYSVMRIVRTLEGNTAGPDLLALWMILETRWPSLADHLRDNPESIELLGKPAADLAAVPEDLRVLFGDTAVRRLVEFEHGGPLTPDRIRECCGRTVPGRAASPPP